MAHQPQNPYEILNLDPNSSIEEVNRAYFYIAKIYHPNKGGSETEFLRFQQAYKQIVDAHSKGKQLVTAPKDFMQLRGQQPINIQHQFQPEDFRIDNAGSVGSIGSIGSTVQNKFSQELFNRRFQEQQRGAASDDGAYTYNIDEMDITNAERHEGDYKREYAQVTAEVENITPFAGGRFNNTTFNQAFVHLKEKSKRERGEIEEVKTPNPTASKEIMACTNLEDPRNPGTGEYTGFGEAYMSHQNPNSYDKKFLLQFQGKPDITKNTSLSTAELCRRISDRQNMQLDYNKEKLITDLTVPLQAVEGLESKKAEMQLQRQRAMLQEQARLQAEAQARAQIAGTRRAESESMGMGGMDMFARMAALRSPLHIAPPNMLGPDRPMASSARGVNRETTGYIAQPAAVLLKQPRHYQGTPPPIQKKRKHQDDLQQTIKRQQKLIKKLSKQVRDKTS